MIESYRRRAVRYWTGAAAAALLALTAACSGATEDIDPDGTIVTTASVTQTAPTVWATDTDDTNSGSTSSDEDESESEILPGLTPECTAAIRGHALMSDLLRLALEPSDVAATDTATAKSTHDTTEQSQVDAISALTEADVDETFAQLDAKMPPELTSAFDALRTAADEAVGKPVGEIPDLLTAPDVDAARQQINDYITECQPPAEDEETSLDIAD